MNEPRIIHCGGGRAPASASLMAALLQFPKACQTHVASRLATTVVQAYNGRWRLAMQQGPYMIDYSPSANSKEALNPGTQDLCLRSWSLPQSFATTLGTIGEPVPPQSKHITKGNNGFLPSTGGTADYVGLGRYRHHMHSRRPCAPKLADRCDNLCRTCHS